MRFQTKIFRLFISRHSSPFVSPLAPCILYLDGLEIAKVFNRLVNLAIRNEMSLSQQVWIQSSVLILKLLISGKRMRQSTKLSFYRPMHQIPHNPNVPTSAANSDSFLYSKSSVSPIRGMVSSVGASNKSLRSTDTHTNERLSILFHAFEFHKSVTDINLCWSSP